MTDFFCSKITVSLGRQYQQLIFNAVDIEEAPGSLVPIISQSTS